MRRSHLCRLIFEIVASHLGVSGYKAKRDMGLKIMKGLKRRASDPVCQCRERNYI